MPDDVAELLEDYAERWLELSDAERMAALGLSLRVVVRLDRRSAVTVLEEVDEDGRTTVRARPAQIGLDPVFIVGAVLTLITAGIVPIAVAALT
jgi:hypothetical protein